MSKLGENFRRHTVSPADEAREQTRFEAQAKRVGDALKGRLVAPRVRPKSAAEAEADERDSAVNRVRSGTIGVRG